MRRRLLTSIALLALTLPIVAYAGAKEPTKQTMLTKDQFKPIDIVEEEPTPQIISKLALKHPFQYTSKATPQPTPEPTAKPTPKPTPKPTSKPVTRITVKPMAIAPTKTDAQRYAASKLNDRQYSCLYTLWMRESHWNHLARNKSSGAYGIPQALPGSKMAKAGADWETNPITQVKWGLGYISGRYGTACNALNHSYTYGWY